MWHFLLSRWFSHELQACSVFILTLENTVSKIKKWGFQEIKWFASGPTALINSRTWTPKSLTLKPLDFTKLPAPQISEIITRNQSSFLRNVLLPRPHMPPSPNSFWLHSRVFASCWREHKVLLGNLHRGDGYALLVSGGLRVFLWPVALFLISCLSLTSVVISPLWPLISPSIKWRWQNHRVVMMSKWNDRHNTWYWTRHLVWIQ